MTVNSFVPEIWSDVLAQSLKQARILDTLVAMMPPVMNDPIIMVCGRPWWLSWWDVTDVKPVRFIYLG